MDVWDLWDKVIVTLLWYAYVLHTNHTTYYLNNYENFFFLVTKIVDTQIFNMSYDSYHNYEIFYSTRITAFGLLKTPLVP